MPHYADGRVAQVGDIVRTVKGTSVQVLGILVAIQPLATTCNGSVVAFARKFSFDSPWYPVGPPAYADCLTLSEMLPAEFIDRSALNEVTQQEAKPLSVS